MKAASGRVVRGRRTRLPLLLVAGVLLIGSAWGLRSSPWVREQLLRGKTLPELEAAARSRPEDAVTRYALAKQYYLGQRFRDSETAYRSVLEQDPRSARARLGLALSLYELGSLGAAQREFEHALTLNPKLAWAEYMLGKIAWLRGRLGEAVPHVQRAIKLDSRSAPAWYALGVCYLQQRRYDDAIPPLQRAIALEEANPRYHTALGEVLVYRGRNDDGRKHLERALELNPNHGPACALMGNFYLRHAPERGARERAETLLLRAAKLGTYHPEQLYLDLGDLYFQERRYEKAREALLASSRIDPRDERPYYILSRVYRRLGQNEAAAKAEAQFQRISKLHIEMQALEARISHNPADYPARLRLARVYRSIGLASSAAGQYSAYLQGNPNSKEVRIEFERWIAEQRPATPNNTRRDFVAPPLR